MRLVAIQKPFLDKINFDTYLSKSEINKLASLSANKKNDWVLGRIALKTSIRCKNPNNIEIRNNNKGVPYIFNNKTFCSIAHSNGIGVGIASSVKVGIDVEIIRPHKKELLEYIATSNEINLFKKLNINIPTTYIWVIKESVLKALNIGISYPMKNIEISKENDFFIVKCKGKKWFVKIFKIKEYIIGVCFQDKMNLNSIMFEYLQ